MGTLLAERAARRAIEAITDAIECLKTGRTLDAMSLTDEAIHNLEHMKTLLNK